MRRVLCVALAVILTAGLCACGAGEAAEEETTLEDFIGFEDPVLAPTIRPIPDDGSAEIEKNKEFLLNALPIDDVIALRCAEALYCYCVPELAEVKDASYDESNKTCTIEAFGIDNATYGLVISLIFESPAALYKEGEKGREMLSHR